MTNSSHTPPHDDGHDPAGNDRLTQRLSESAHQVWLAGLGAFNRAQSEGSRVFDSLVRDGQAYEERGKTSSSSNLHDNLASGLGQARERTARTWDKMEHALDDQVQAVLRRLKVPTANEITALQGEIAALRQRVGELEARQRSASVPPSQPAHSSGRNSASTDIP